MHRILVVAVLIGCGGGNKDKPVDAAEIDIDAAPDALAIPVFRNPVALPDAELALQALKILGANVAGTSTTGCKDCHALTRQQLRNWRVLSDTAMANCLTDLAVGSPESARTMIDCVRSMPQVPTSDFLAKKLGIYASGAHLPWFQFTVRYAYGQPTGSTAATAFATTAGMPRSGGTAIPLTQPQFDIVTEWFARGLPRLDETLPQDPPPQTCDPSISVDVPAHITSMKTLGWRAVNASNMMAMFGCGAATDPKQCLATTPLGSDQAYGAGWDVPGRGKLRILADEAYRSSYWTRSSPDGRFMAHGVQNVAGSYVIDLQRGGALIPINVAYDPNWFPDNSGFVFQGGPRNTCGQSVLTSNPVSIAMTEPACSSLNSIGLYEHVGRLLGGGDHFAVDSEFVSDDGGHTPTHGDPDASFGSQAQIGFIPLIFDGTKFAQRQQVTVKTAFEGDTVLSPSARLAISRVAGPNDVQLGYVLRKVNATMVGTTYTISTPEVARYCVSGGKPGFSYDERWVVFHHYLTNTNADAIELGFTGTSDPGFTPYAVKGAANIYLMDLGTGAKVRITNMNPGQYALFPHFRSDGWIYGAVRDTNADHEYMVASDAALIAE